MISCSNSESTAKLLNTQGLNLNNLYCPRCSCLILKAGTAKLDYTRFEIPSIRKDSSQNSEFNWMIRDMMTFENIGFTHSLPNQSQIKRYMACAECDLGNTRLSYF